MRKAVILTSILSLALALRAGSPAQASTQKPLIPLTVEQMLRVSDPEKLLRLANERASRLAEILEHITDEPSATELGPQAQRHYLEVQLIEARISMLPPPSRDTLEALTPLLSKARDIRLRLFKQCQRIQHTPGLPPLMETVVRPLMADLQARNQALTRQLLSQLQTLRAQILLYKVQHKENLPDFRNQGWAQLTRKTDPDGQLVEESKIGPYLAAAPINPLTNRSRILITRAAPPKDFRYPGDDCGYIIEESTGQIWALDSEGRVFNESPLAQLEQR